MILRIHPLRFIFIAFFFFCIYSLSTFAQTVSRQPIQRVRPFITDDSRVVGNSLTQLETWFRNDNESAQQWVLTAFGPTDWLEVTFGGVFGIEHTGVISSDFPLTQGTEETAFSYGLPLLQAKFLLRPYKEGELPGVGLVIGTFLPFGSGLFKPPGYGTFGFLTLTQTFGKEDDVLIHANLGFNYLDLDGENSLLNTWGFGTQIRLVGGFHLVGEIFSGDPYVPGAGTSIQGGFRHFFSDDLQIDGTVGKGFGGENPLPFWVSGGVRIVFHFFN